MHLEYFIKGLIIGFSVAAPVGPICVLTIKRTLAEGRTAGFVTGMGATMADTVYGFVAGFGLTLITGFLIAHAFFLKLVGGSFLLYLGIKFLFRKAADMETKASGKGLLNHFISTFFLTITNPATIVSFLAIFAGMGLGFTPASYTSSAILVMGVFTGSALWWLILSYVVSFFQAKVTPDKLIWINRLSGVVIISFGLYTLFSIMEL